MSLYAVRKYLRLAIICLCSLASIIFVSCKKNDVSKYQAGLIAGNWVVNGKSFIIRVDDQKFSNDSLSFPQLSTTGAGGYTAVGAGFQRVTITSGATTLINNTFSLVAGKNYTLLLYDTLKNNQLKLLMLKDDFTMVDTLVTARFLQMIPTADSVRILLTRDTLGYYTSSVYVGQIVSTLSGSFPLVLPPGTYSVSLSRKNVVTAQPVSITLLAGKAYTFFAKGVVGGTGVYAEGVQVWQHN